MHIQVTPNTSTANTYTNAGSQLNRHHLDSQSSLQPLSSLSPQAQTQTRMTPSHQPVAPQPVVIRTVRPRAADLENQGQQASGACSPRAYLNFDHPRPEGTPQRPFEVHVRQRGMIGYATSYVGNQRSLATVLITGRKLLFSILSFHC